MVDIVGFDTGLEPKRLALIKRQASETFPLAGDYSQAIEWAGMRPATPSGVPLIGASVYRNLWLNLGHGALGFTLACGSGQLNSRLSGAVTFQDLVFLSGQVPGDGQDVATQTQEVLAKIDALLAEAGSDKDHLLNATIYLKNIQVD
eukprot:gene30055-30549_t